MQQFETSRAADFLVRQVASGNGGVPDLEGPATRADAYRVQDALVEKLGGRSGWKVGRPDAASEPYCAPLPAAWKLETGQPYRPVGGLAQLEAEIGFRLGSDLDPGQHAFTPADAHELIDALVPAVEILGTRLAEPAAADPLWKLADLQKNGGLVLGEPVPWAGQSINEVRLAIGTGRLGSPDVMRHPFGGPLDLFCWTVNHVLQSRGRLRRGEVVITGSYCGVIELPAPAMFQAVFEKIGKVSVEIRE